VALQLENTLPEASLPSATTLIGRYRELPAISGRSFLPISFLGRLPTTMVPLAILTFTATSTGSYRAAGLAATATAAGTAFGAPLMGRFSDRHGQRPVLTVAVAANAVALTALALVPQLGRPGLLSLCALVGVSLPPIGGMARARWLALTRTHAGTAMAFEGTADEVAYVLGPAVAGLLASLWGPASALLAAAVAGVFAAGAFAAHPTQSVARGSRSARPPVDEHGWELDQGLGPDQEPKPGRRSTSLLRRVLVPVMAMMLMGGFFAATQNAVTVYAAQIGRPSAGGLIYALMAIGSAGTALATPALPARFSRQRRCAVASLGLLLGVLAMAATVATSGPAVLLCTAMLFTGLSVGPILVTLNQVVGEAAPTQRAATAMAYLSAGGVVGIGIGATSSGALADTSGGLGGFAVGALASMLLLSLSVVGLRTPGRKGAFSRKV
jgi:MFS family permease